MISSFKRVATVTVAAAALIGGGAAMAAIPAPDGTITACVKGRGEYFPANGVCKKGQNKVTWNAKGIQGEKGLKGDKGDKGDEGDEGPIGPSAAYYASVESANDEAFTLPAGDYVINVHLDFYSENGATVAGCWLDADGSQHHSNGYVEVAAGATGWASKELLAVLNDFPGGDVVLNCGAGGGTLVPSGTFAATKVGSAQGA